MRKAAAFSPFGEQICPAIPILRLDLQILTPQGLARLRDPKATLRLAFDPVF